MASTLRRAPMVVLIVSVSLAVAFVVSAQPVPPQVPGREPAARARRAPAERVGQREPGRARQMQADWFQRRVMERIENGEPVGPEEERWIERYLMDHLLRVPSMDALDSAHYAAAEIHLARSDYAKCLERLDKVLASFDDRQDETAWVTHLNIANICRRRTGDMQRAIREYKLVQGIWAGFAQRELLRTLEEMGQLDEAVNLLVGQYDAAKEKGERLALLQRVAELYERNEEMEKAIAVYDRITTEFTRADIEALKKAAAQYVSDNVEAVVALREAGRFEEAQRLIGETHRRLATLRSQGRQDEARAMEAVLPQAIEKLERWERAHREGEQNP